ncbi:hypothetical protein L2827_01270 [Lactobacillus gasseri]|nr:hypothetical protein [Lactobacillus gasseri]MCZ3539016.1 hypothetical protein [Lactobacillus gasseri]MCZ3546207.1 hypothetical protein [Lactobacillus gasseri]MCZ3548092.1 hypothetical protein [Lactobacillus gasseri]MCZ3551294.1 hypothetical protein [Lactobacillus gasseri]
MTWTIINSIMSAILIPTVIYNSYVHKKTQRMLNDAELEVKKYLTEVEKSFEKQDKINDEQAKFNEAATTNFMRHEDALRIIVNHIKNAE